MPENRVSDQNLVVQKIVPTLLNDTEFSRWVYKKVHAWDCLARAEIQSAKPRKKNLFVKTGAKGTEEARFTNFSEWLNSIPSDKLLICLEL